MNFAEITYDDNSYTESAETRRYRVCKTQHVDLTSVNNHPLNASVFVRIRDGSPNGGGYPARLMKMVKPSHQQWKQLICKATDGEIHLKSDCTKHRTWSKNNGMTDSWTYNGPRRRLPNHFQPCPNGCSRPRQTCPRCA